MVLKIFVRSYNFFILLKAGLYIIYYIYLYYEYEKNA